MADPVANAFDTSTLTDEQRALVVAATNRCSYDFSRCLPALRAQWGRTYISAKVSDLSRWAGARAAVAEDHDHPGHHSGHIDVHDDETGADGHGIVARHRVLGLAWSNGVIEVDQSLVTNPELFAEVFLSEVAHEVDWFDPAMDQTGEDTIFDVLHGVADSTAGVDTPEHGHGWFDVGTYEEWAGEAWMGLFTAATSDVSVTLTQFVHKVTPDAVAVTRRLLGIAVEPLPPVPEVQPVFATATGKVFHDAHSRVRQARWFDSRDAAIAAGLRPCGVCKP